MYTNEMQAREVLFGRKLEVHRDIDAAPEAAWELLVKPKRWPEWGPTVRAVDFDGERISDGSTGRVQVPGRLWIPFEIDLFSPLTPTQPGRWSWNVARIPATGHRVERRTADSCRVVFELPTAAIGYLPVCRRALSRIDDLLV